MDGPDVFNKLINKIIVCYYCLFSVTVVLTFLEKPQMRKSKVSVKNIIPLMYQRCMGMAAIPIWTQRDVEVTFSKISLDINVLSIYTTALF